MVILKPVKDKNQDTLDIKLIDFGLASKVEKRLMKKTGHVGTY